MAAAAAAAAGAALIAATSRGFAGSARPDGRSPLFTVGYIVGDMAVDYVVFRDLSK